MQYHPPLPAPPPPPPPLPIIPWSDGLRIFMLKFYVNVFRTSLFPNPLMDLVYVRYMYEAIDWSNILHSTIPTLTWSQGQGHGPRIFMLKFYIQVLIIYPLDSVDIWYEDIYWSKILCCTIPSPYMTSWPQDMNFFFFMLNFHVKDFRTTLFTKPYDGFGLYMVLYITKTCLYNFDPLKPHFYIVKLGFKGVYIIFLISAQKHRLWVLIRGSSNEYPQSMFWAETWKISEFFIWKFSFFDGKIFSIFE